ncbi:MAG: 16S rRNA (cytosine(1402)-N(4))-methyltransferase RsmH [Gammaproteobacteria bacterium]|nr:16S rRNA (cytosine(1402)-N(4))-methyltransferase RsmH [Gammaproteobacteria bacterium]
MAKEAFSHQPVLLEEVLKGLSIKDDGKYVDGTFGRGGHSSGILERLGPQGRLMVVDKDPQAIAVAHNMLMNDERVIIARGSFIMLKQLVSEQGWLGQVDGLLLDLGVSSPQLDDADRGFSFKRDGVLDMRMDPDSGVSAAQWLANVSETELVRVLRDYGEERFAKRIARAIVKAGAEQPITSTRRLAQIITDAHPKWEKGKDPATRSFQAIRIEINNELKELQVYLSQVIDVLKPGGRFAIISFHSLEDRIVKRFIRDQSKGDRYPVDLPVTQAQLNPKLKPVEKALRSSQQERQHNPRARSSVLRIAEKR